jgi:hypothetical protein
MVAQSKPDTLKGATSTPYLDTCANIVLDRRLFVREFAGLAQIIRHRMFVTDAKAGVYSGRYPRRQLSLACLSLTKTPSQVCLVANPYADAVVTVNSHIMLAIFLS